MTKIYEALEQAKKVKVSEEATPVAPLAGPAPILEAEPVSETTPLPEIGGFNQPIELQLEKSLAVLYHNLALILPRQQSRIIQFISARPQEGSSRIIREFAKLCAIKYRRKVLLVDLQQSKESQMAFFDFNLTYGWNDAVVKTIELEKTIHQVDNTSLYVTSVTGKDPLTTLEPDSEEINNLFETLSADYEFILVDMLTARNNSTDTLLYSRVIDGVILVVEAEKTRWQVVDKIKHKLIAQGANILGVILNKRQFHIPGFIYKYL